MIASTDQRTHARAMLFPEVRVVEMSTNGSWIRDSGPTFVIDGHGHRRVTSLALRYRRWRRPAWCTC
jgi:agmatine deiminase